MNEVIVRFEKTIDVTLPELLDFQGELKTLDDSSYERFKSQLLDNGFTAPFHVWIGPDGQKHILDGHQRTTTLKRMAEEGVKLPKKFPANVIKAEDEKRAKKILLGLVSTYGKLTDESLGDFIKAADIDIDWLKVNTDIPDIDMKSFAEGLLGAATTGVAGKDEDEIPETPKEPVTKPGDMYEIGRHRILCGDATRKEDWERLFQDEAADLVFTDPPYGVDYEGGHNKKKRKGIKGDKLEGASLTNLFRNAISLAVEFSKPHAAFYIWYANGKAVEVFQAFGKLPLKVRAVLCWYKVHSGLGAFMAQYIPNYEPCIYAHHADESPQWFGPSDEKTVWELKRDSVNEFHPTQKPVGLPERAIRNSSQEDQIVCDCFLGSGSTLIAAEKQRRICYGMEIDPAYCDVIISRYLAFAGKTKIKRNGKEIKWTQ